MANPFEVLPYTPENLVRLFSEKAGSKDYIIHGKQCFDYLKEYFVKIGAKTVIIENEYVDRDFLIDFSAYYVRSFHNYKKHCSRLHLFDIPFKAEDFVNTLGDVSAASLTPEILQQAYLGFLVIKPLPVSVVGRTCFKIYKYNGRQFLVTRTYTANLYGIPLKVESLAFQEQDSETNACASISIWTIFQITGLKYLHPIPAPVEITQRATTRIPLESRTFPHRQGLSLIQMSEAIRSVSLEPVVITIIDEYTLKGTLYSYLRSNIPVLLTMNQYEPSLPEISLGLHAVAATGYTLEPSPKVSSKGACLLGYRINEIYVHDDQIGPFSPMKFVGETKFSLWSNKHAQIMNILVPLPPQIRITLETIYEAVSCFDYLFESIRGERIIALENRLEWDIYLNDVANLKNNLLHAANLSTGDRIRLLTKSMPHFLWRATAFANGSLFLDLLFDATGVQQNVLICSIDHDTRARTIQNITAQLLQSNFAVTASHRRFLESYVNQ